MKAQYIAKNQGQKVLERVRNDQGQMPEGVDTTSPLDILKKMEKVVGKKYLQWVVNQYVSGAMMLEDVNQQLNDALTFFTGYKGFFAKQDINAYSRKDFIAEYLSLVATDESEFMSKRQAKLNGAEYVFDTEHFKILNILTHDAAVRYGANTQWCTNSRNDSSTFDNYKKQGDLYVIIAYNAKTEKWRKYQFHYESDQFMDETDSPVDRYSDPAEIDFLSSFPEWKDFLEMMIEKHLKQYFDIARADPELYKTCLEYSKKLPD